MNRLHCLVLPVLYESYYNNIIIQHLSSSTFTLCNIVLVLHIIVFVTCGRVYLYPLISRLYIHVPNNSRYMMVLYVHSIDIQFVIPIVEYVLEIKSV